MKDPQGSHYQDVLTLGHLHVKHRVVNVYPVFISSPKWQLLST